MFFLFLFCDDVFSVFFVPATNAIAHMVGATLCRAALSAHAAVARQRLREEDCEAGCGASLSGGAATAALPKIRRPRRDQEGE